jgi:hypothetical protein
MGNKRPTNESRNKPKNILEKTSGMKYNIIQNVIDLSLASQTIEEINKIEQEWEKIFKNGMVNDQNRLQIKIGCIFSTPCVKN